MLKGAETTQFLKKGRIFAVVIYKRTKNMGITIDTLWAKAQRLSPSERLALSRRLAESVSESETDRRKRVTKEMEQFFGGWVEDERTTDEIMAQIRAGRTSNTYPRL